MANRKTSSKKKTTSKKTSTKKTINTPKPVATVSKSSSNEPSQFVGLLMKFKESNAFLPTAVFLAVLVVIGIDLLASWNDFIRFFRILGFEIIIVGIAWVLLLAIRTFNSASNTPKDEN